MAEAYGFTSDGAHKIVETVRQVGKYPADLTKRRQEARQLQSPILPTIGFAQEDIEAGGVGTFRFAKGMPGEEEADTDREVDVCNSTHRKIKSGWKCILSWLIVESSGGSSWHAVRVFGYDRIKGQLVGAMATTDTTWTIDNIEVLSGADPRTDSTSTSEAITISNSDHSMEGDDNGIGRAEWNPAQNRWEFYQVTCKS